MSRKNILFIARWYPDRHDPMLGLFVQKHARAVQAFHDVTVLYVTADKSLPPGKHLVTEEYVDGIYEIKIYFGKHRGEFMNGWNYVKYYMSGLKIASMEKGDPSLVHVHILSRTAIPAIFLKITKGIPYIITEHWSRYLPVNLAKNSYAGLLRKMFTKFAVGSASALTTVTRNLADAMQALGLKNKYYITPNVADTNLFRLSENKKPGEIKKLVHVSCFDEPAKNIKGIINVIEKLSKIRSDFRLDIIGDGIDFNIVKNYAEEKGLSGNQIVFHGLLTGEELSSKMRDADVMIMFSNYENLPCTIVESLCCGVPVISTDVGGIKEHLLPDYGSLVKPGNEEALFDEINRFLDHPGKFNNLVIRKYGADTFSMAASGKLFNEIYISSGMKN